MHTAVPVIIIVILALLALLLPAITTIASAQEQQRLDDANCDPSYPSVCIPTAPPDLG
jgi:hypothetical protein